MNLPPGPPHHQQPTAHDQSARKAHDQRRPDGESQQCRQQVPVDVAERRGGPQAQPEHTGQEVDRQGEAVHLGKQRHDERREHTQVAPLDGAARSQQAENERAEDERIERDHSPQSVIICLARHGLAPSLMCSRATGAPSAGPVSSG